MVSPQQRGVTTVTSKVSVRLDKGVRQVYLPLPPVPAARPRVSKWGSYYPKSYAVWKQTVEDMLTDVPKKPEPFDGPVYAMVTVGAPSPKKPANVYPVPDVDNYAKAVLDAGQKCGWLYKDDKQVVLLLTSKRYVEDGEKPYAYMMVSQDLGTLLDGLSAEVGVAMGEAKGGEDVYDLPPAFRTPIHMLEE